MTIPGVLVIPLTARRDDRGWLIELFRSDTLPSDFLPEMGYVSYTHPGVSRGPHEHREQSDGFAFIDGTYELHLWENRSGFAEAAEVLRVGQENPVFVIVPPGVVHGYKNVGDRDAFVFNVPDKLYAGRGRSEPVDEIRHESDADSRFRL